MCVLFAALGLCPEFPVILASNRDEDATRPTETAHYWKEKNGCKVFGGIDLIAGGTWLAASNNGHIGVILNCKQPHEPADIFSSRGDVVSHFVQSSTSESAGKIAADLVAYANHYKPFNFFGVRCLPVDAPEAFIVCQPNVTGQAYSRHLTSGVHAVGNVAFDSPVALKKMDRGKMLFDNVISTFNESKDKNFDVLQQLIIDNVLTDSTVCYPDTTLQQLWIEEHWDRLPSIARVFVSIPSIYQTRCSTVVAVDKDGYCHFKEYTWAIISADSKSSVPTASKITSETFKILA